MFTLDYTEDIDAPAEVVWRVITDLGSYREWNPFLTDCSSTLTPGDPIDMQVRLSPGKPRRQREWMLTHTPGREFSYRMKPVPLGALRSRRSHTITALGPDVSRYESHFELAGWLSPLVTALFGSALRRGFSGMTTALVERAIQLR